MVIPRHPPEYLDLSLVQADQLIGEVGKGNSYLQVPVRDLNENTPIFTDSYDDIPIYQVYEHINQDDLQIHPGNNPRKIVSATDADRCWYGNGLITFR